MRNRTLINEKNPYDEYTIVPCNEQGGNLVYYCYQRSDRTEIDASCWWGIGSYSSEKNAIRGFRRLFKDKSFVLMPVTDTSVSILEERVRHYKAALREAKKVYRNWPE